MFTLDPTSGLVAARRRMERCFGSVLRIAGCVALLWLSYHQPAHADFYQALVNYKAGKFTEASAEFLSLAELGDGPSQFNLGAMSARGEGRVKDVGVGVGWMLAAAENGYGQLSPEKLAEFKVSLNAEQKTAAENILAQYGSKAMRERVLPGLVRLRICPGFSAPEQKQIARPIYPIDAWQTKQDGIVIIEFTVGKDGLARDPQILASAPAGMFDWPTVDAILESRFQPAMHNGEAIEFRASVRITYSMQSGGVLWKLNTVKKEREAANKGNPYAKYVIGVLGTLDPTLNIPEDKARAMILSAAQVGVAPAQYWVAQQLHVEQMCGNANKMGRWLQQAAAGGEANAQLEWAKLKLAAAENNTDLGEIKALLTSASTKDSAYAMKHAAAIFAVPPNEQLADKDLALQIAQRLKKYDDTLDPQINEVIAAAHAVNDNYREAVKQQELAIKKARKLHWNTQNMESRLTAYRQDHPPTGDLLALPPTTETLPPVRSEIRHCQPNQHCGRIPDISR